MFEMLPVCRSGSLTSHPSKVSETPRIGHFQYGTRRGEKKKTKQNQKDNQYDVSIGKNRPLLSDQ